MIKDLPMEEKTIHLLLVEDDKVDQMAFVRHVKQKNLPYEYTIAGSVAEGEKILETASFDVIVSDYWLGDGVSFELFEQFKDTPVIVTTGTGNEEVAVEAMKLGASDYLIKDPDGHYLKTLATTVDLAIQRKKNERELENYHKRLELMVEERTAELQAEIIERHKAETSIRKSENQWHRTFNSFTDIVTLQTTDFRIIKINQSGCDTLNLSCDEIGGYHCYELFTGSEDPCNECPLLQVKDTFEPYSREMYHEKLEKTFLVSASPVFNDKNEIEYIAHVAKDITEQKKLESLLRQSQKMEAIGTLAGGIAHDFNNILAAILGYAEFIQMEAPPESHIRKDIDKVIQAGGRAVALVKQILTLSRQSVTEKQPIRPHLIVKEAMKMLHASLPSSIIIEENIDPDCGAILADATNIHQITINLCTNALHAMSDGKGTLSVSLQHAEVSAADLSGEPFLTPGSFVVLMVRDTGCGMDTKTIDRIFEPYFTTKEVGKGTGLGLAVIHGIVQDTGGFIRVVSEPGIGSSFVVYLPVLQETGSAELESKFRIIPQGGSEHILVVDDEPLLVRITQRQLERLGYTVTAVYNSNDALEIVRSAPEKIDLLITDQTMPGLTGMELALAVMQIKPELPVILCTGHSDQVSKEKALELGIQEYVFKPIVSDELFKAVRSLLDAGQKGAEQ